LEKIVGYCLPQYTACDLVLLFQVYYYRRTKAKAAQIAESDASESTALLSNVAAPPSTPQPKPILPPSLEYPLLLLFVIAAGVGAWYLDQSDDVTIPEKPAPEVQLEWKSQTLGWISAVLYLGSRVPQIAHNKYVDSCL